MAAMKLSRSAIGPRILLGLRKRAVDETDRNPQRFKLIHLIFHQRDERRNDKRQPVERQGGQLIAKTLAAAGRHDAKAIAPGQHGRNHLLLSFAERA